MSKKMPAVAGLSHPSSATMEKFRSLDRPCYKDDRWVDVTRVGRPIWYLLSGENNWPLRPWFCQPAVVSCELREQYESSLTWSFLGQHKRVVIRDSCLIICCMRLTDVANPCSLLPKERHDVSLALLCTLLGCWSRCLRGFCPLRRRFIFRERLPDSFLFGNYS